MFQHLIKCSHKHNKKELKILKESCEKLRDKLLYEYEISEQKVKIISSINCTQKNIENILDVMETPESELNKCTVCDKKIRFQKSNYKMEEFIDWTSLLEDIKYLDKDLENVQLEELLIEDGIEVSDNVLSLKTLAPGYRTYRKITKEDIMIDIEKTKCMLRRNEENVMRAEKDKQEKRAKEDSFDNLRILHGLDSNSDWKLHLEDDQESRVPFIKEVCHMNLNYLRATDLKTRATTSWPKAACTETELEMMILSHKIEKKVDEMLDN